MDEKELRIGNYIKINYPVLDEEFIKVDYFIIKELLKNENSFKSILLTKELLFEFGFEKHNEYYYSIYGDEHFTYKYMISFSDFIFKILIPENNLLVALSLTQIKYVHQLQNLFF